MKNFIKQYGNYVFRKIGKHMIATNKRNKVLIHEMEVGESDKQAFNRLKMEVGLEKRTTIWEIQDLGEVLIEILETLSLILKKLNQ